MTHFTSIIGSITLDESSGLQNDFTSDVAGDLDDNDIEYDPLNPKPSYYPQALWDWLVSLDPDPSDPDVGIEPLDVALSNYRQRRR